MLRIAHVASGTNLTCRRTEIVVPDAKAVLEKDIGWANTCLSAQSALIDVWAMCLAFRKQDCLL